MHSPVTVEHSCRHQGQRHSPAAFSVPAPSLCEWCSKPHSKHPNLFFTFHSCCPSCSFPSESMPLFTSWHTTPAACLHIHASGCLPDIRLSNIALFPRRAARCLPCLLVEPGPSKRGAVCSYDKKLGCPLEQSKVKQMCYFSLPVPPVITPNPWLQFLAP